jgi:DNA primase
LPFYSQEIVAQVLGATDIVDLVASYVELQPAGTGRFKARCPFHNEKTPSFHVTRDRQVYHCFGCGKGGDALSFVREHEGLSFPEALQRLADRARITLPALSEGRAGEDHLRSRLLDLGKFAARVYRETLASPLKGGAGRAYLKGRHLKAETTTQFGLGFAPEGFSFFRDAALEKGYDEKTLLASGLVKTGQHGGSYDFFRNRLMFPIRDVTGHVVAFGGRALGGDDAKYINSPENAVYKKSHVLYGLYEAREAMRREKRALLVEGYFDLLRCFDAGIQNVVATCGTALTPGQAALIHRYVPEVVVVYDGDAAGVKAAMRSMAVLTEAGLTVRALALPDDLDPDDFVQRDGAEAFRERVEEAHDFVSFYVTMSGARLSTIEGRSEVAREVFAILSEISDTLRRDEYLKRLASRLQINPWTCRNEYDRFVREQERRASFRRQEPPADPQKPLLKDDLDFLAALLNHEPLRKQARELLGPVALPWESMAEVLAVLLESDEPGVNLARRLESAEARRLYVAAANHPEPDAATREVLVAQWIGRQKRLALEVEKARVQEAICAVECSPDREKRDALLMRKVMIQREIEACSIT